MTSKNRAAMNAKALSVPSGKWTEFFRKFNELYSGWQSAIDLQTPGEIAERIADGIPLQSIFLQREALGTLRISVAAGPDQDAPITHRIDAPRSVYYSAADDSAGAIICVQPAIGPTTLLRVWVRPADRRDAFAA